MSFKVYDFEVLKYDWLVVFKDVETKQYYRLHNDPEGFRELLNDEDFYVGFNCKHYDQFIAKAVWLGWEPTEIKELNDYIINGNQGWNYPGIKDGYFVMNNVDLKDDVRMGISLKEIEGHLGLMIKECDIPFDIDRPLTEEEIEKVFYYCERDVDAAEKLLYVRKDYLSTKLSLGRRAGIPPAKALSATNAKLTAMMLHAVRVERDDGREYVYPPNLDVDIIPEEVKQFFDTIHDESIPDEVLFKTSLDITIGDMPCKFGWGGVHGSLKGYYEEQTDTRVIQNRDVSSLYPSLIERYNYLSRNVDDPKLFTDIKRDRIAAKHKGDKKTAKDLKLPLNTVSGAQENKYNDLYDPLPTRSLRISGQLFLTVLVMRLLRECKTIRLLNYNTDGLMYSVDKSELSTVDRIAHEWEQETGFELEVDEIGWVQIKDVNNLILKKTDDSVKAVGGELVYGISEKGAWAINNSMIVVKKAIIEYFVNGTPVEEFIANDNEIFDYQIIAKAGAKYREAYHVVDGEKVPVQKVNRVYATANERYGKLYKVKAESDSTAKIEKLPEHCIIDNENTLTIADVDKNFYIGVAKEKIMAFKGIVPEKPKTQRRKNTMATAKKAVEKTAEAETLTIPEVDVSTLNIWQKLARIRMEFAASKVEKTGINTHAEFTYFELPDIVPVVTKIMDKYHTVFHVTFLGDSAQGALVDVDNPQSAIQFIVPQRSIAEPGKYRMNEVQALGAETTYIRRYLYYLLLDITNKDEFDGAATVAMIEQITKRPATPVQRADTVKSLTNSDGAATELQIKGLKSVLKRLKEARPDTEAMIQKIALDTNGFTEVTKTDCEALIQRLTAILDKEAVNA